MRVLRLTAIGRKIQGVVQHIAEQQLSLLIAGGAVSVVCTGQCNWISHVMVYGALA